MSVRVNALVSDFEDLTMSFLKLEIDGANFKEIPINEDTVRIRVSDTDYIEVSTEGGELEIRSNVANVNRTKLMTSPITGNAFKVCLVYR